MCGLAICKVLVKVNGITWWICARVWEFHGHVRSSRAAVDPRSREVPPFRKFKLTNIDMTRNCVRPVGSCICVLPSVASLLVIQ